MAVAPSHHNSRSCSGLTFGVCLVWNVKRIVVTTVDGSTTGWTFYIREPLSVDVLWELQSLPLWTVSVMLVPPICVLHHRKSCCEHVVSIVWKKKKKKGGHVAWAQLGSISSIEPLLMQHVITPFCAVVFKAIVGQISAMQLAFFKIHFNLNKSSAAVHKNAFVVKNLRYCCRLCRKLIVQCKQSLIFLFFLTHCLIYKCSFDLKKSETLNLKLIKV